MIFKSNSNPPGEGVLVNIHGTDWRGGYTQDGIRVNYKGKPCVRCFFCASSGSYWRFKTPSGERIDPIDSLFWSLK